MNKQVDLIRQAVDSRIYYLKDKPFIVTDEGSVAKSEFYVDHTPLSDRLQQAQGETPWTLGPLAEGEEWLAVTFREQKEIPLTTDELESFLQHSEQAVKDAYARMSLDQGHAWMKHVEQEVNFALGEFALQPGQTCLDFGCGLGRHTLSLAEKGWDTTGVDFVPEFIDRASQQAALAQLSSAHFQQADCRTASLDRTFDAALCLYDVVGSFAEAADNQKIIERLAAHLKPGAPVLISVMNMEMTEYHAKHLVPDVFANPAVLTALPPSKIMQKTGNVFDPDYYLIDQKTGIVYRKEQFTGDTRLPAQLIIRDRRYRRVELSAMCEQAGLETIWTRCVQAGHWDIDLPPTDRKAKEILYLGRKR